MKAFDTVDWGFLIDSLRLLGFRDRWIMWIRACLSSARLSNLLNGSPFNFFKPSQGLRQGDPLSPLLFTVVAEILTRLVVKSQELGIIEGLRIKSGSECSIPVLQFADDTLFTIRGSLNNIAVVKSLMVFFESLSGLSINFEKSSLIGINLEEEVVTGFAGIMGCKVERLPIPYLGAPLGSSFKSHRVWDTVLSRIDHRLTGWKKKLLSRPAKLVLIKSTVNGMLVYLLSLFVCPTPIIKEVERRIFRFLWDESEEKKRIHLVAWENLQVEKEAGGLGIANIAELNKALLFKWLWRFSSEDDSLWRRAIFLKYGAGLDSWKPKASTDPYKVSIWRPISRFSQEFLGMVKTKLGGGGTTRFWHDNWVGNSSLASQFPYLFNICTDHNLSVSSAWNEISLSWDIQFKRRRLGDNETAAFASLIGMLPTSLNQNRHDKRYWISDSDQFSVRSTRLAFERLRRDRNQLGIIDYPSGRVWHHKASPRACFAIWLLSLNRLLSDEQLKRRGYEFPSRCSFCLQSEESTLHLFFDYNYSDAIWSFFAIGFNTRKPVGATPLDRIRSWNHGRLNNTGLLLFRMSLHAIVWELWKERNARRFEEVKGKQWWQLVQSIQEVLWTWGWAFDSLKDISFERLMCDWASVCWQM